MMFDTGATALVDAEAVARLGLVSSRASSVSDSGTKPGGKLKIARLSLGGVTFHNLSFTAFDYSEQRRVEGVPQSIGILGYEIPKRLVTSIDYRRRILTLTRPQRFQPPVDSVALDFDFVAQLVQVNATLDGHAGRFVLDTGSRGSVFVLPAFVQANGLDKAFATTRAMVGWGIGGPITAPLGRAHELTLGGNRIPRPLVGLFEEGGPPVDGNIGGEILKRFDVTFDYSRQKVWLKPSPEAYQPDETDLSGLWMNQQGDAFIVAAVAPGSPADRAGFHVGELVEGIDGAPTASLLLSDVRDKLKHPGTHVVITLRGRDAPIERQLSLSGQEFPP